MILDNYIDNKTKIIISIICGALSIYFTTSDCYQMITRLNIFPVIFVSIWIYLNYIEPLFLPIGLLVLIIYSNYSNLITQK